jgi:TRAP-type C4-dicarboxylate transport system substrate-binding protein
MNAAAWRRLADRFKTAMADAFGAAAVRQRADQAEEEAEAKAKLGKRGMAFDTVDTANFRAALREAGYYRDLKKRFGDANWDLLERQTGRLA